MIDTHCHLTYPGLVDRLDEVMDNASDAGVTGMITVGTTPHDSAAGAELTDLYPNVWSTVGVHPLHSHEVGKPDDFLPELRQLATRPGVVALGEMGLDRHYDEPPIDTQRAVFEAQLELARDLPELSVIIHNRKATDDTLASIKASGLPGERFLFHCFTGSPAEADAILATGARIGFTGVVTFKGAKEVAEASDRVPLDRLMIETDAPYLTPEPYRKIRPNEPRYVAEVAAFLAERRSLSRDEFVRQVDDNATRFFNLS